MKIVLAVSVILLFAIAGTAQPRQITAAEYDRVFQFAVSETNAAFPFIFTVTTESFKDGAIVRTVTEVHEREAAGRERSIKSTEAEGKITKQFKVSTGFGVVYCSDDEVKWNPPTQYECGSGIFTVSGARTPENVEYSVEEKSLDGKKVKVYREYSVFAPYGPGGKKTFIEEVATIESQGFFISVVNTEGTFDPPTVTLKRKQTWDFKTNFKPIVAPAN